MTNFKMKRYAGTVSPMADGATLVQAYLGDEVACAFAVCGDVLSVTERDGGGITATVKSGDFQFTVSADEQLPKRTEYIATSTVIPPK